MKFILTYILRSPQFVIWKIMRVSVYMAGLSNWYFIFSFFSNSKTHYLLLLLKFTRIIIFRLSTCPSSLLFPKLVYFICIVCSPLLLYHLLPATIRMQHLEETTK